MDRKFSILDEPQNEQETEETAPFWMISFSDLSTLLLAFFVMLYSYSSLNVTKADAVSSSLKEQFGPNAEIRLFMPSGRNRSTQEMLPSKSLPVRLPQQKDVNGIILFPPHSHELSRETREEIQAIVPLLKNHDRPIGICGHAGSDETGAFRDPTDLGYARAYAVRNVLVEQGIAPSRIQVQSLGEFHPIEAEKKSDPAVTACVEIFVLAAPSE